MAKLADIDSEIRILLRLFAVALTVVVIIFIVIKGGTFAKNLLFPTPEAAPQVGFGKLPSITLSPNTSKLDFRVNTISGTLPGFGDRINVYSIKRDEPSLVALGRVRDNLATQGFSQNETKIGDSLYQWADVAGDTIQYNLLTNNFKISSNFLTNPPPPTLVGQIATQQGAYTAALTFLQSINVDTSDIDPDNVKSIYLKIDNGQLVETDNAQDAQFIQVFLFQKNVDKDFPIYYPQGANSSMSFIFDTDSGGNANMVEANFDHYVVDSTNGSTYPLKSTEAAFEDLQKGKAVIFNQNTDPVIDITDVSIGYYLGENNQKYLLPIIIFKGKNFLGFVPATP